MKQLSLLCVILLLQFSIKAQEQSDDFESRLKEQEKAISAAYRASTITRIEYNKLVHEQDVIKDRIKEYQADGNFTTIEKDTIFKKLQQADERLAKYSEK